ncbi:hypothetical protein M758_10G071600 [Ceratodon purpureus]|nr:hypothetical protein M758_10G071600 [Ceratodon purpureus]
MCEMICKSNYGAICDELMVIGSSSESTSQCIRHLCMQCFRR